MFKNVTGQKVAFFAWDAGAGIPKTGDRLNITAQISKDGGASAPLNQTNPAELDATNQPGIYVFDLTQAETNADLVVITPKSSTANVEIRPFVAYPTLFTGTKAGYLDAVLSTRLAAADYMAPDNAGIAAVKAKTDNLPTDPADQSQIEAAITAAVASLAVEANIQSHAQAGAAVALAAYDPPTKAELDSAVGPLAMEGSVKDHARAALDEYGPPTRAEATGDKEAILAGLADLDALLDAIKAKTDDLPGDPASQAAVLNAIAALNDITVGDLLAGDLSDTLSFPANSLADLLRKLFWILCNRLVINDATGAFTGYKSDGITPAATGAIAADGSTTERRAPTWP